MFCLQFITTEKHCCGPPDMQQPLLIRALFEQKNVDTRWDVVYRGAWAGRLEKDYRRSQVTTHEMCKTQTHGTAEKVLEFFKGLGFALTYDVMKDGYQCLCHNDGFGVDVMWALVCPSQPTVPPLLPTCGIFCTFRRPVCICTTQFPQFSCR